MLAKYPDLIKVRTKEQYIEQEIEPNLEVVAKKKRSSELAKEYDERGLMKDISTYAPVLESGDDNPMLKKHWEHRHHGHFSVKK
ncbi:MAG TPA: hypothetical protein PLY36_06595 [Spirochaetota bacterium]|nr:hypothetical protein [Spirochaetota bacterium]